MLVTMKPIRGRSSPSCHSTFAMTLLGFFQDAARYEKSWKKTFGFLEGLPTGRVIRWSLSRWRLLFALSLMAYPIPLSSRYS